MKCPRLVFFRQFPGAEEEPTMAECIGVDCAWYDRVTNRCRIMTISIDLDRVALHLGHIADHMPYKKEY